MRQKIREYARSLDAFYISDITLHITEDAEALTSQSRLAELAEELSSCGSKETPLIVKVNGLPKRIWLSFKNNQLSCVPTSQLVYVTDLLYTVKNNIHSRSLSALDMSDITLHTTEHAEALTPHSRLADLAEQLSPCGFQETPLIIKAKSNAGEAIVRFWTNLPEATLVGEGDGQYLQLKDSHVLGDQALGQRFLVRPIYKELCEHFERVGSAKTRWVVAGTPGIGKTFFTAYYLWIAACKKKTVLWQPFESSPNPTSVYLMTSGGVEWLPPGSSKFAYARDNPDTIYIVDDRPPYLSNAWTLLVTSPLKENYKHIIKNGGSDLLYMPPWSYEELKIAKPFSIRDEGTLPTTLMERLYNWFGGVPRYVLAHASNEYKAMGNDEEAVFKKLYPILTSAMNKRSMIEIMEAHDARTSEGEYSHHLFHLCGHPSGNLNQWKSEWASLQVQREVTDKFDHQIRNLMVPSLFSRR
ncbi:hypothetical protein PSHT_10470 [Puccinia striiformis]|uniref:Uncharacterized protein n=1 Tax=Puccinia striiformis TaxID=27350 RepID=A0A2S4V9K4_9BASI|nr:hypothetical protein PSHT_10470 [Puccinia striiformis]